MTPRAGDTLRRQLLSLRLRFVPRVFTLSSRVAPDHSPMSDTRRILVVEDDPRVGSFIAHGLRDDGYDIEWAVTGEDALVRADARAFDLVILDHMLPGCSGIDVARTLRAAGRRMPILMLTARDAPEDRRAALAAGTSEFMGKPFRFADLVTQIESLLEP